MKLIRSLIALAAVCLIAGCETTGLSPREHSGADYPNYILALPSKPSPDAVKKVVTPIRLAVAQVGEAAPPKQMLDKLQNENGLVLSVVGLPLPGDAPEYRFAPRDQSNNKTEDFSTRMKSVCNLARSVGADYIFIFGGSIDSWQQRNGLGLLDISLVGAAVLPSTKINLQSKAAGALIETVTGEPVAFVNVEASRSASSSSYSAGGRTETMRAKIRDESSEKLTEELLQKLAAKKL